MVERTMENPFLAVKEVKLLRKPRLSSSRTKKKHDRLQQISLTVCRDANSLVL